MLVLSRKVGEEVIIGGTIRVRVLAIHGNQIRLGLVAPREVPIQREELLPEPLASIRRTAEHPPVPDVVLHLPAPPALPT